VSVFRKFSYALSLAIVVMFLFSSYSLQATALQSQEKTDIYSGIFPEVVAMVNGEPIYGKQLEVEIRNQLVPLGSPKWPDLREDYRGQLVYAALTTLINTKLMYMEAVDNGVRASDGEVQDEYLKMVEKFENEEDMNDYLNQLNMDQTAAVNDIHKNLVISKFIDQAISSRIALTPELLETYYSENPEEFKHPDIVRTSQILIESDGTPESDSRAKQSAQDILERIENGEDFAELVRKYSAGPSSSQGGDIGFYSKEALPAEYAEVAFSLPVGKVKMMKAQQGYQIIKVTDKKKEGMSTLKESEDALREFLKEEITQTELLKLVNGLRDKSEIEYLIPAGVPLIP